MNKDVPFPQADSMDKIIKIINISDENLLKSNERMRVVLGDISSRVVQYYLTASRYLDIIDNNNQFTTFGYELREQNEYEQQISLSIKILSISVFAEVFLTEKILGINLNRDEVNAILKKHVKLNTEKMYDRRAQTVLKWVEWINSNFA